MLLQIIIHVNYFYNFIILSYKDKVMTITQLQYIIAVDTHRHFARAAESCFVTQPNLKYANSQT